MTTVLEAVIRKGKVIPLDREKVDRWVEGHKEGEVFELILSDFENQALTPMARKYFATRDEYAKVNGYTNDHARIELEYLFGVTFPEDSPPKGPKVRLREYHGDTRWFMSITDYDKEALARLVQGSEMAVTEAST